MQAFSACIKQEALFMGSKARHRDAVQVSTGSRAQNNLSYKLASEVAEVAQAKAKDKVVAVLSVPNRVEASEQDTK